MVWSSRADDNIFAPQFGPNREGEAKGAAQVAYVSERKNSSLRNVRPRMEEEDRKHKIIVKATAIVHGRW